MNSIAAATSPREHRSIRCSRSLSGPRNPSCAGRRTVPNVRAPTKEADPEPTTLFGHNRAHRGNVRTAHDVTRQSRDLLRMRSRSRRRRAGRTTIPMRRLRRSSRLRMRGSGNDVAVKETTQARGTVRHSRCSPAGMVTTCPSAAEGSRVLPPARGLTGLPDQHGCAFADAQLFFVSFPRYMTHLSGCVDRPS